MEVARNEVADRLKHPASLAAPPSGPPKASHTEIDICMVEIDAQT